MFLLPQEINICLSKMNDLLNTANTSGRQWACNDPILSRETYYLYVIKGRAKKLLNPL